jgi:hypothetical protein
MLKLQWKPQKLAIYTLLDRKKLEKLFHAFQVKCLKQTCQFHYTSFTIWEWHHAFTLCFICSDNHQYAWQFVKMEEAQSISKTYAHLYSWGIKCRIELKVVARIQSHSIFESSQKRSFLWIPTWWNSYKRMDRCCHTCAQ